MDGDPVGASVGFRGAFEGDWLGLEVGCSDVKVKSKKYMLRYPSKCQYIPTYTTHNIYNRNSLLLMASSLARQLDSEELSKAIG